MKAMHNLLDSLPAKSRRGSKPRCHWLTHGAREAVAKRLTNLVAPFGLVRADDRWMPEGFQDPEEGQLHDCRLLPADVCQRLRSWWLVARDGKPRTPNWDIASTCEAGGQKGLLLVEAKAHDTELTSEAKGRELGGDSSEGRILNHGRIGKAIEEANAALNRASPGWNLSRDSHYQLSNRFAWCWKLTELGFPVILVYLGFLNANEMSDRGKPFAAAPEWEALVRSNSDAVLPATVWNAPLKLNLPFIPLIRSTECSLETGPYDH